MLSQPTWWSDASYHDREQTEAINYLQARLSAQASRYRREADQARRDNQRVAGDLAGLASRVDDYMEYTDLRFELLKYSETGDVRAHVERRFRALAGGETPAIPEMADVAGYWLPPAAGSVLAVLSGPGSTVAETGLDIARSRDPIRTELLALSAGIGFEREALSQSASEAVLRLPLSLNESQDDLADDDSEVSQAWRLLWTRAAHGEAGDAGYNILRERLAPLFKMGAPPWLDAIHRRWKPATALAELRSRCEAALSSEPGAQTGASDIDQWRGYLQELVTEGHGDERPILARIAEIRHGGGDFDPRPVWQRPVGTVAELARRDLIEDEDVDLSRRRLTILLCADDLAEAADRLRDEAILPAAVSRTFKEAGRTVTVTADGADLTEVEARLAELYPEPGDRERRVPVMVAAVAVAAAVGFALVGSMWAIIAFVVAAIAAGRAYRVRDNAKKVRDQHGYAVAKLKARLGREQEAQAKLQRRAEQDTDLARRDHAALIALIAADSKPRR